MDKIPSQTLGKGGKGELPAVIAHSKDACNIQLSWQEQTPS